MRYDEGPTVEVDALVAAPIERVWELVTDIDLPARFSTEFQGGTWLDDPPAVGARFVGRNHHAALGGWETTSFVSRWEPLHHFAWCVSDLDHPSASWWFDLAQEGDGVRLRQGTRIGPAPSGLTPAIVAMPEKEERIIARRLREHEANMRANLEGIRALAEGAS